MPTTTGQQIKAARKAAGLTQAELADKAGMAVNSIRLYESGKQKELKISTVRRIAAALGLAPLQLLGDLGGPLLQAIRAKCLDCCNGQETEVRRCQERDCPLYPFRAGLDSPGRAPGRARVKARARARQRAAQRRQEVAQ